LNRDAPSGLVGGVHQRQDIAVGEAATEVSLGGGIRDALGAEGVEEDLVVAPQLDVLDALPSGEDVEGDVQDVVGLVIGAMDLEKMEVVVDVTDQAGRPRHQEHGTNAASGKPLDTIGQFVMYICSGHDGNVTLGFRKLSESIQESLLPLLQEPLVTLPIPLAVAFPRFLGEHSTHSKAPYSWSSEDLFHSPLFQNLGGFSR